MLRRAAEMATSWRFDRGTLIVHGPIAASWQGVIWDDRTQNYRASAHRYAVLKAEAVAACEALDDPLPQRWSCSKRPWTPLPLRPYQRDALTTWLGQGKRGVIVLPRGAGKTHIAVGAAAALRVPTAILCPTRVLLGQWVTTLRETYGGEIGAVGDVATSASDANSVLQIESRGRGYRSHSPCGPRHEIPKRTWCPFG